MVTGKGGEVDVRGCYTALAVAHILDLDVPALVARSGLVDYVRRCQVPPARESQFREDLTVAAACNGMEPSNAVRVLPYSAVPTQDETHVAMYALLVVQHRTFMPRQACESALGGKTDNTDAWHLHKEMRSQ